MHQDEALLLLTKIRPPSRPASAVHRERLLEQLNTALPPRSILVSAPPGFGKTTLLTELVRQRQQGPGQYAAWYSLDESDNALSRFLLYLVKTLSASLGGKIDFRSVQNLLRSFSDEDFRPVLIPLINLLDELEDQCTLVLDDYHTINSMAVHSAVSFLLQHLPPQLTMAIGSRSDPPLQVSRLRARGQLLELRAADLRFTADESSTFLQEIANQSLSADDLQAAERFTEGWAAGLQLLAIGLRRAHPSDMQVVLADYIARLVNRRGTIDDYLAEEVLAQQPDDIQQFMLKTSILNGLSPEICTVVTGREDSAEVLKYLERSNLFVVPLEGQNFWYRYHHLFSQFLKQRLQQDAADQITELNRRAVRWYRQNGLYDMAIRHAVEAADFGLAADVVEEVVAQSLKAMDVMLWSEWLGVLPEDTVLTRPVLALARGLQLIWRHQHEQAMAYLDRAEAALDSEDADQQPSQELKGIICVGRALMAANQGRTKLAFSLSELAFKLLPQDIPVWRTLASVCQGVAHGMAGRLDEASRVLAEAITQPLPSSSPALIAFKNLAYMQEIKGNDRQALATYRQAVEQVETHNNQLLPEVAALYGGMAALLYQQNDLDAAETHAAIGAELGSRYMMGGGSTLCLLVLTDVWHARGLHDKAREQMQTMVTRACETGGLIQDALLASQAFLNLRQGRVNEALVWAKTHLTDAAEAHDYRKEQLFIYKAKAHLMAGEAAACLDLLAKLKVQEIAELRPKRMLYLRLTQAQALLALDREQEARQAMHEAIKLAAPEWNLRSCLDEGANIEPLMRLVLPDSEYPDFINTVLMLLQKASQPTTLVESLSQREQEVLHLVASGASNQELATALSISVSTVKVHLSHIMGKLEVRNRTEAVARARELGLI